MTDQRRGDPTSAAEALRQLDEQEGRLDGDGDETVPERTKLQRLRRQLFWILVAMLALGIVGFGGGWLFARISGETAARMMLSDRVQVERETAGDPPSAGTAPTWGESDDEPRCGVEREPVSPEEQLAVLGAGGAVVQYRPGDVGGEGAARLAGVAEDLGSHLLVAPNPEIEAPVVATSWEHRLAMDEVETAAVSAFVDGYTLAPEDRPEGCPLVR